MSTNLPLSNEINKDATLEELKMTKQGWLDMARQAGYPNICWEIVRWLGTPIYQKIAKGRPLLWESGKVAIYGNEYTLTFDPAKEAWEFSRSVSVYVRNPKSLVRAFTQFDEIILNSDQVLFWSWSVYYDERGTESVADRAQENFFVNGSWILSVRDFIGQAQAKKEAYGVANVDAERQALLVEMLAGVNV